jgi:hypothetical protein
VANSYRGFVFGSSLSGEFLIAGAQVSALLF